MKKKKRSQQPKLPQFIISLGRIIEFFSYTLAARYAGRLFTTPFRHKMPNREWHMDRQSAQSELWVEAIRKKIIVYEVGNSQRKILLVHGWSGRGTQLVKIADALLAAGYSVVSFDAPAHGKSPGSRSIMPEFIASILAVQDQFGPFMAAIGHSLGGMSILNASVRGLQVNSIVTIGSGDVIQDIIDEFTDNMQLSRKTGTIMRNLFESTHGSMDEYSAYRAAAKLNIPVLVIHDENDAEVLVDRGIHIHRHLKYGELMLTQHLGHRKILGSNEVISRILTFLSNNENHSVSIDSCNNKLQRSDGHIEKSSV